MDLTLQSYLNEAVFSAGRGQEATFVSYLQRDASKEQLEEDSSTSSHEKPDFETSRDKSDFETASRDKSESGFGLTGKGSFISYIDDESDSDEFSVGSVLWRDDVIGTIKLSLGKTL